MVEVRRNCARKRNARQTGAKYEEKAAAYLESHGYRIAERNFRCRIGEIDLIALHGRTLVFVEVKYRRDGRMGSPAEAVTPAKQRTICKVADYYRMLHGVPEDRPCRFDVVAVEGEKFEVLQNAFPYCL